MGQLAALSPEVTRDFNVALLHQRLAALGFTVARVEVDGRQTGPSTREMVRALQAQLGVPVDERGSVDLATGAALEELLKRRGLTEASRSFTVTGRVQLTSGAAKSHQRLLAFDLDLRAVGVYRTAKTLADLDKNGGCEFLGEAFSDGDGHYRVTFYDWQYRRAERKKADVVVFAVGDVEGGLSILAQSRLVTVSEYSEKGLVDAVDIVVPSADSRTEYEQVMSLLTPFLDESGVSLATLAGSADQVAFAASELDLNLAFVSTAAAAQALLKTRDEERVHEVLYGIGRQDIELAWRVLYRKRDEELLAAVDRSVAVRIIRPLDKEVGIRFVRSIRERAAEHLVPAEVPKTTGDADAILRAVLPRRAERVSFLNAAATFRGTDFREFWAKDILEEPEFKASPHLVSSLLLTQQLAVVTGHNVPLVKELQVDRKITSPTQLMELDDAEWLRIVTKTGVPGFVEGTDEQSRARAYAGIIQGALNAAFPTQRLAVMAKQNALPIEESRVAKAVATFLADTRGFDVATSRLHDFDPEITATAGEEAAAVKLELKKLQRVFQVSPSPGSLTVLLEQRLHSAHAIADIPRGSFLKTYGSALGGERTALAVHQRASHIARKTELSMMHMLEYARSDAPAYAISGSSRSAATAVLQKNLPNYSELFGSPDLCECEHCRSVRSAASYFVELLRFLWRGEPNADGRSPLDLLDARRPDLKRLLLTCENTNTVLPYIDLANEVMEYYTAHGSVASFHGYDTGTATAAELRANPQNFNLEAYRTLKDAKYPFTLPYHQPLDVIRTYSDHLNVSRYDAMKAINPSPSEVAAKAVAAESLRFSEDEFKVLTGEAFDGTTPATAVHEYFGYAAAADLEKMSGVREFLARSGVGYPDLVELTKTRFINPHQWTVDFLGPLVATAPVDAAAMYEKLRRVRNGTLVAAADPDITAALSSYNTAHGTSISAADLTAWITAHFDELRAVVTLYQSKSSCDLDTTSLRTLGSLYEAGPTSGLVGADWTRIHRFIRLWKRLGWTIHETDLMLASLGHAAISGLTVTALEAVLALKVAAKLPVSQLAVLWGAIDSYGDKSLYAKLFLNKAVQQIDDVFRPNAWGNYLQDSGEVLGHHRSAILAAFRIREEDLNAIAGVSRVIDGGAPRAIDLETDILDLANLSVIYRHVVLSNALKIRPTELSTLIALLGATPVSTWDVQQKKFVSIDPTKTLDFFNLAILARKAGFKTPVLEYVLRGTVAPTSTIGLDPDRALQAARAVRQAFSAIKQDHPQTAPSPMTPELLTAKLALTFAPGIVNGFLDIIQGSASSETLTDKNLPLTIPEALAGKYTYVKGSGRLISEGVMTDAERAALAGLAGATAAFKSAVDELYAAPQAFIAAHFGGVFSNLPQAEATLLDHPAQAPAATLDQRLAFVYESFVPILKRHLRTDAITQHIAALIGLTDAVTALLIDGDVDKLVTDLSTEGFSADYFSDPTWTTLALQRTDATVDADWGLSAPAAAVPADGFSVRWQAYIAAPASGEYTVVVEVREPDEAFKLFVDDVLVLEKAPLAPNTSLEAVVALNAAQMHALRLEYVETGQNAGVHLRWKRATTGLEVVPPSAAYPATILDAFAARARLWHRAAKFISAFRLTEPEIQHLVTFASDFGNVDFTALTLDHWKRVRDYTALRAAIPQAQATLTDVFVAANTLYPAPTVAALRNELHRATAWNEVDLAYLVGTHFVLGVADFRNEVALNRLRDVMAIVERTGLAASTVASWGAAETDFDDLHATAQLMKNAVKAKYEEKDWLAVAGGLSDVIRERQKQALVGYLLTRPAIQSWGARDADGLFEYFLIDVQMGACMDTSRIVQANSSVQMFVSRCLLGLESDTSSGSEKGVSLGAVDQDRWEWMKNYRVWEANREVFLYPENWLEPEWRMDRSELFRDLESYLVQNDINDRSVEQAFRGYLAGLAEIGNLEMCGLHQEYYEDGRPRLLHAFGRTRHAPYSVYYRTWNEYRKWSAWQKIPVSVRMVENGAQSGVHLIPVVWKKRLFLFWPEFLIQHDKGTGNYSNRSTEQTAKEPISQLEPRKYWDIRLAWSECTDGKWSPKQLSSAFLSQNVSTIPTESRVRWIYDIDASERLHIVAHMEFVGAWLELGRFSLADITSTIDAVPFTYLNAYVYTKEWDGYHLAFMNYARSGPLHIAGDDYLAATTRHKVLATPQRRDYAPQLDVPFFFGDAERSYFVRPVDIDVTEWIKAPWLFEVRLPSLIDDSGFRKSKATRPLSLDDLRLMSIRGSDLVGDVPMLREGALSQEVVSAGMRAAVMPVTRGVTRSALSTAERPTTFRTQKMIMSRVNRAFGSVGDFLDLARATRLSVRMDKGLEFHTLHHPYSGTYVKRLNEQGLPGLMASDTALPSDAGATFETVYQPRFAQGFVQKPVDFANRTYYKESVCFDVFGANSQYNWELFLHAPMYIATRLSRNGRYREAMKWFHYIFDPTSDAAPGPGESETSRYWKVMPFKTTPAESLEDWFRTLSPNADPNVENAIIGEWRDHPFDPHLIAANRPLAYMKHVVIAYVQNLVAWADSLFRQDTMESVNEALQIYVIANHILGPRPERVPRRGTIAAESYQSLEAKWDDFSNALVELENVFPYSSESSVSDSATGPNLLGVGAQFYFCIPPNAKLLKHWDTVADRLYKIRHCQNIDGVERKLALFSPPIDPGAIIQALSQGLSLGSILADLSSPPPIYRFSFLIQKANEFCADVRGLGTALLAALERRDAEELGRLRASQERALLEAMKAVKERQLLDARVRRENLEKLRDSAVLRLEYYADLLGVDVRAPAPPTIAADLNADSTLPADSVIAPIEAGVDVSLVDSDESGVKLIPKEKEEVDSINTARRWQIAAQSAEGLAAIAHVIPTVKGNASPFGVGSAMSWGGMQLGNALSATGKILDFIGAFSTHGAALAQKMGAYIRREQDWAFQARLAAKDVIQLHKQITSADIQVQVAQKELDNHVTQIQNAQAVERFLQDKFTGQELFQWQKEQLFDVYKRGYNLAYELAKKAEKAYKFEIGTELASFVQYGYWDDSKQGLVAGERLQLALRQLENAYLADNRRELELTKSISLAQIDPLGLVELRERGRCRVSLPEERFDLDFRGHYYRRIRAVRLSIPCVAGPYTSVSCSLRLLSNSVRTNTALNSEGNYEHEHDGGVWIDDDRFRTVYTPVTAIATSMGQDDSGMFEFSFRDERYLPFERAGAISEWEVELSTEKALRPFDYSTIADVILHLSYTAREDGGLFKQKAATYVADFVANAGDLTQEPLSQSFDMKHEFPGEWHKLLHPPAPGDEQALRVVLGQDRFPFLARDRVVIVGQITVMARCSKPGDYCLVLSYPKPDGDAVVSSEITLSPDPKYGELKVKTIASTDAGLNLDEMDVARGLTLKLKRTGATDFASLATQPTDELQGLFVVIAYRLG